MLKDNEKKMHLFVVRDVYSFLCIVLKVECKSNISRIFYQSQKHLLSINLSGNGESSKFQNYRVAASFTTAEIALQRSLFLAVLLSATKLGTNSTFLVRC